jgi:hypothetical protein
MLYTLRAAFSSYFLLEKQLCAVSNFIISVILSWKGASYHPRAIYSVSVTFDSNNRRSGNKLSAYLFK